MADLHSVLRSYDKLHGILILLKPNDQKLDVMFKFCVQELLIHLHRDAARNIAFGFTNTRGANYLPGDTFDPLRQLLGQFKEVKIDLRKQNVYCFDSEIFRYLAAQKQHNKSLGHLDENRASWNHSVRESKRLIDYFSGLEPHRVTGTVNLHETRHRTVTITEPMATIAERIRSSINVNGDDIRELLRNEKKTKELQGLLKAKVKTLNAFAVDRSRTACAHADCVDHSSTGIKGLDGKEILTTVYQTLCHSPCRLKNVKVDNVGDSGLKRCWAMKKTKGCRVCGHSWMEHLHIDYEVKAATKEIDDPAVAEKRFIGELESELKEISDAAARFSNF